MTTSKPPSLLREELKRAWRELRGPGSSPLHAALAVAIGLFVGSQPAFGTHTPIVLLLCLWLQLDAALCWVAANISIPPIAVFLVPAEVQLGSYLHTGKTLDFDWAMFVDSGLTGVVVFAFTGSAIIGGALALVGGSLVYGGVALKRRFVAAGARDPYRLPANAPPWWHAAEKVAARYVPADKASPAERSRYHGPVDKASPAERSRYHYVRVKLLMDPVSKMVADLFDGRAAGEVLDIGTGRGQIPVVLLELGRAIRAHGIDWDGAKIDSARAAAQRSPPLPAHFERADVREAELPQADTVLLIDVIHYLPIAEQDRLLDRAAAAVRSGGQLIVREADSERGWRSTVTWAEELLFTALRFNRGASVRLRPAREIAARLEQHGLRVRIQPAWGKTPFSNVLVIAAR